MTFVGFAMLLLCAVSGHTLSSTVQPLQEMNMEDSLLHLSNQISNIEKRLGLIEAAEQEQRNQLSTKFEEILHKISEIEKASKASFDELSERLLLEKNKFLVMDNHLLFEVQQQQKKALETFEKITHLENDVKIISERAAINGDLQARINETMNSTHSCLASHRQIEESVQMNTERIESVLSDHSNNMGSVEVSLATLRKDIDSVSNKQDANLKLKVANNTNDVSQIKEELLRIQSICSPPCENGGQCVKNVCNCPSLFTGDGCQQALCSPPCENGGQCMENNTCNCTSLFSGDRCENVACIPPCENGGQCMVNNVCNCTSLFFGHRCQDWPRCGVDLEHSDNTGGGNNSSSEVWPWIAAIYRYKTRTTTICEGSVIHSRFVLTSAYCAFAYGSDGLSVKLGWNVFKNGCHLHEYRVSSVHIHPHYRRSPYENYDYNVALLQMEKPIIYTLDVRPVCLPPPEVPLDNPFYKPESTMKAINFRAYMRALSSSQNVSSNILLHMTTQPFEVCRRKIEEQKWGMYFPASDHSFCAESTSCSEHGSPFMQSHLASDGTRIWTQVGIRGRFYDCKYIVSPRLQHFVTWINATIEAAIK